MDHSPHRLLALVMLTIVIAAFSPNLASATAKNANQQIKESLAADSRLMTPNVVVVKLRTPSPAAVEDGLTKSESLNDLLRQLKVSEFEPVLKGSYQEKVRQSIVAIDRIYWVHYQGSESPKKVANLLAQHAEVVYAEPKYVHEINAEPNDPRFTEQSFLNIVSAQPAWDVVKAEDGEAVIAIVDGGTDIRHEDLAANLWLNSGEVAGNGIDDDNNGFVDDINGWNFANDSNDPTGLSQTPSNADHGTHTAGIAAAVTDNATGVAGMSWNAKIMAINASSATSDRNISFGYEGILYAGLNGADIISLSWGSQGSPSLFEQDVIDLVTEMGSAVVAAAGNDNSPAFYFPASYRNVLAVANTSNDDTKSIFSNFGNWVDLAAPGEAILSTFDGSNYGRISGTSMSCPLVAGVAALVKTQHPDWTPNQVAEQVRVTSDNIDGKNPSFTGMLGRGRLNALSAVTKTSPAVRITAVEFEDGDNDEIIEPGESVSLRVTIKNYLAGVSNLSVSLIISDPFVTLDGSSAMIAEIGTLEEQTLATQFGFSVANNAPSGHPLNFTLQFSSSDYQDVDRFALTVLPLFGNIGINNLATSVTNIGRIGFVDANNAANGVGVSFQNGPNLLFEGGLIAGTAPNRISNAVRGLISGNTQVTDEDFAIVQGGDVQIRTPGAVADQESISIFDDRNSDTPLNIRVTQETFAQNSVPNDDFIFFRYTIENTGTMDLNNFHFGLFFDWDIDGGSFASNRAGFDAQRNLGYAYDTANGPDTYIGVALVDGSGLSYRAIYNDPNFPNNPSWGLHDGFTDAEKWQAISGGLEQTSTEFAEDIAFVIGAGPYSIEPNNSIEIALVMAAGTDLVDLQTNVDAAAELWENLFMTAVDENGTANIPVDFALQQNHPNPFNPATNISFALPRLAEVKLEIYDTMGRRIRSLIEAELKAGHHTVRWDGRDDGGSMAANGLYLYRLRAGDFVASRKMLLLK